MAQERSLTLLQLNQLVGQLVQQPETQNVWVTAELSDVSVRGGHCYMELLEKDDRGAQMAKARAVIWASVYPALSSRFQASTGQRFATGLKVMLRVSVTMHPVFGFSLVVSAVNPEYTMGDLLRRRHEILRRLQAEGILELNRRLPWPVPPQRIAVVSAPGAAGYGDFLHQLYGNTQRLRFTTRLFPATMQGAAAPASIISALERIAAEADRWDGVVIIRGGGATSDLAAFEDYDLAANVAQFPLPVAIGIGHERDVTVLDWVANARLKTPTAVAEWLIAGALNALDAVVALGNKIVQAVTDRLAGNKEQLANAQALLPVVARGVVERGRSRLASAAQGLANVSARRIHPALARLDMQQKAVAQAATAAVSRQYERLDRALQLLEVLSPMATLRRGYSITRIDGRAVTTVDQVHPGSIIETTVADGVFLSHTP